MKFKMDRQKSEYNELLKKQAAICDVLIYADEFSKKAFQKEITITEIYRTQEEQDAIYRNNVDYQKKPWKSVHQYNRGADLRVWTFTKDEIEDLKEAINARFKYKDGKETCIVHDVGAGLHFHVQVV